ncbi:MAG: ferrochelatase [Legionella sp.]|nr:ferrochelatase [Legionella sp.]
MKHGVLLINLGTPSSPTVSGVRAYLREFLTDKRVIDLPAIVRYLLVYGIIIPFRTKKSTHAYQSIWTPEGSPLFTNCQKLTTALQQNMGEHYQVVLGMRYGKPSLDEALHKLKECSTITVIPLYPQYSSAATGSSIERVFELIKDWSIIPTLRVIRDFYADPAYIEAQATLIKPYISEQSFILFSYHGLPERQINKGGCLNVCQEECPAPLLKNPGCYKAQCHQTSHLLAQKLNLSSAHYQTAFQSRLGKTPWIKPYTEEKLTSLSKQGVKNLIIACPSFTADCLETLEEIKLRAQEQWHNLGGETLTVVPCLNAEAIWVKALKQIVLQ